MKNTASGGDFHYGQSSEVFLQEKKGLNTSMLYSYNYDVDE